MTKIELDNIWSYYLALEADLENTSRYVEPTQKDVYSFEFQKIIILACCEVETAFKYLCDMINDHNNAKNIPEYREIILNRFPKMQVAKVYIARANQSVVPFCDWSIQSPEWWRAYQQIKHNRGAAFSNATYWNAAQALAGLYILIFYLSAASGIQFHDTKSSYIFSEYANQTLACSAPQNLPDFE